MNASHAASIRRDEDPSAIRVRIIDAGLAVEAPAMFPGAARTPQAIVVSYSTVPDGWPGGEIGVRRSLDGGVTWEHPQIVARADDHEDAALGALGLTVLRSGEILLPYNTITWTRGRGVDGHRLVLRLLRSSDHGRTWAAAPIVEVDFLSPAVYGQLVELDGGELLWPVWGKRVEDERWSSIVLASTDSGESWRIKGTIAYDADARLVGDYVEQGSTGAGDDGVDLSGLDDPDFRPHDPTDGFNETTVIELEDGRLLAVLRQQGVDGDQELVLFRSVSEDGGATWSPYESLGFSGMSPMLFRVAGGVLLGSRRFAPEGSGIAPGVDVRVGSPDGSTWGDPVILQDPLGTVLTAEYQCGYPAVVPDEGGNARVYFYSYQPGVGRYIAWNLLSLEAGTAEE